MSSPRGLLGSTVIVPVVTLWWGSTWSVAGVAVDQRWLLVPLWGGLAILWAMSSRTPGVASRIARRGLTTWRAIDPFVAALLVQAVLFRVPETFAVPAAILVTLVVAFWLLGRASGPVWVAVAAIFLVVGVALPRAFEAMILAQVSATYALDVDHRPIPNGGEINSDGARFRGEATDLAEDDFVVLFLGDSFTFGFNLAYEDSYPYRIEAIASERGCRPTLRAVNMGWTSSSPLLALRLLREVGYEYRPDLILYGLDMTDFHDDLRYEWRLREQREYDFDAAAVAERYIASALPSLASHVLPALRAVTGRLRGVDRSSGRELLAGLLVPGPEERFFVTRRPLSETRPAIELGVMKNLAEIDRHAREVLDAPFALVVQPRAYQYSDRESPRNWEKGYEPLGPYVREPFRYFADVADRLPYPVIDILPDFEASDRFPLYFGNDPHWTEQGADVAAHAIFDALDARGLLPCGD